MLAMKNSEMAMTISELEARVSWLEKENATLRLAGLVEGSQGFRKVEELEQMARRHFSEMIAKLEEARKPTSVKVLAEENISSSTLNSNFCAESTPNNSRNISSSSSADLAMMEDALRSEGEAGSLNFLKDVSPTKGGIRSPEKSAAIEVKYEQSNMPRKTQRKPLSTITNRRRRVAKNVNNSIFDFVETSELAQQMGRH